MSGVYAHVIGKKYKVNWNPCTSKEFPYQLYGKNGFFADWYFVASFESLESAKAVADRLIDNPVYEVSQ